MTRDFDAWLAEQRGEPVEFVLGGVTLRSRNPFPASGGLVIARPREGLSHTQLWRDFLAAVLVPEDAKKLDGAITESGIHIEGLIEISSWLLETATGRPTPPRPGSAGSRSPNGRHSKPASRSRALRSNGSASAGS